MQTEHIPPVIEIVPKIEGVRCKMMLFAIYCALTFGPFGVGVWVGYRYDCGNIVTGKQIGRAHV